MFVASAGLFCWAREIRVTTHRNRCDFLKRVNILHLLLVEERGGVVKLLSKCTTRARQWNYCIGLCNYRFAIGDF